MKKIEMEAWDRREIYDFFSTVDYPFYSVTIPVDVTALITAAKKHGLSTYYALIWACTKSCNQVPEFRYRLRDGKLTDIELSHPSFTVLEKGAHNFKIVTVPWEDDLSGFCRRAKKTAAEQRSFLDPASETDDLIYFSCTPWFDFCSLTNERSFDRNDMIPRIAWGRYYEECGRTLVHMSVDVNHRTIDGYHIGRFKEKLDAEISALFYIP